MSGRNHPDLYQPAPIRGGNGPWKLKTLARLLGMGKEWEDRLQTCADETTVPARALVANAVKAAVQAIEKNNYSVMLPMQFGISSLPERDDLPPINRDLLDVEPGIRTTFVRSLKRRRSR